MDNRRYCKWSYGDSKPDCPSCLKWCSCGRNEKVFSKILIDGLRKRKPEILYRLKCEDSRGVENACPAFLLAPTSHFSLYNISGFYVLWLQMKSVFLSVGKRGLSKSLRFYTNCWFRIDKKRKNLRCSFAS